MRGNRFAAALVALTASGCDDALDAVLPEMEIAGTLQVTGPEPDAYTFNVYPALENTGAFDTSFCDGYEGGGDCYGRVRLAELGAPSAHGPVKWEGQRFTITGVEADVGYYLEVTGKSGSIVCSSDFLGFNDANRVATSESAIKLSADGDLTTFELPRKASIACVDTSAPTDFPDPEVPQEPEVPDAIDEDGDITDPPEVSWTSFTVTDPSAGDAIVGDASTENVIADVDCGSAFQKVFRVHGTVENATEAYLRVQYGAGEEAMFETFATPIVDGVVDQELALTGHYAVVQLDTNHGLDGVGESHTVTFCEPDSRPAQQLWVQISWDKDDTDVDLHAYSEDGSEIAYYSMNPGWGTLDIDDVDGFGPETITTTPGVFNGSRFAIRAHYYSDHGNGATTVSGRAIYYDAVSDRVCDVIATHTLAATGDWWEKGVFGPEECPPRGRP